MTFGRLRSTMGTLTLLTGVAAGGADPPQLGKSPTKDVVAAMTKEEKVSLVVGTGMDIPALSAGHAGAGGRRDGEGRARRGGHDVPDLAPGHPRDRPGRRPGRPAHPAEARG